MVGFIGFGKVLELSKYKGKHVLSAQRCESKCMQNENQRGKAYTQFRFGVRRIGSEKFEGVSKTACNESLDTSVLFTLACQLRLSRGKHQGGRTL